MPSAPHPSPQGAAPPSTAPPTTRWRLDPSSVVEWKQVVDARRRKMVGQPPEKRAVYEFFFELDWKSEPSAVAAERVPEFDPAPTLMEGAWSRVEEALNLRLAARRAGIAPPIALAEPLVAALSRMVHTAGARLPASSPLTTAMEEFGAGRWQDHVSFGTPEDPGCFYINDADSYYLWMFAEFGLAAVELDVDADAWRTLLRSLLLAGWFYSHRFQGDHRMAPIPLQSYRRPGKALDDAAMSACRATFDAIWDQAGAAGPSIEAQAAAVFRECLRRVATSA